MQAKHCNPVEHNAWLRNDILRNRTRIIYLLSGRVKRHTRKSNKKGIDDPERKQIEPIQKYITNPESKEQ